MLKQRILTAIILIPCFLLLLFFLPPTGFLLLTALMVVAASSEWSRLMGLSTRKARLVYVILTVLLGAIVLFLPAMTVIGIGAVWWLVAVVLLFLYPRPASPLWQKGLIGWLVLLPCWVAVNYIRNQPEGLPALLFLLVLIWGADSAAYFVGKAWGKHKLAPKISPGKSIEGAIGALVFGLIWCAIVLYFFHINVEPSVWIGSILLTLLTVVFSIIGDLFESMMKRAVNIKDSGSILPGHGGVLDRIDSLTAAAPVFVLFAWWLSRG